MSHQKLIDGVDFYWDVVNGTKYRVFTEHYLSKRGFCCKNNCRHCSYGFKNKTMKQTSLEQFKSIIDKNYLSVKKYISTMNEEKIVIVDYENYAWGKNPDLAPLFENLESLPIKKMDVSYSERECAFHIVLHLK